MRKGVLTVAASEPKIPRAPVHDVVTLVWNQELSRLSPDRPSITSLRPSRIHSLWVTPYWIKGWQTKTKTRNRLRGKSFMVSPAGFEPATTGIRRPALRGLRGLPDALHSLYINRSGVSEHLRCRSQYNLRGDAVVTDTVRRSSDQTTSRDRRETIPQVFSGRFLGLAPAQRSPFIS